MAFPDLESSGGGNGGAGADVEAVSRSMRSISGSLTAEGPSAQPAPSSMYGLGRFSERNEGNGLSEH